MDVHGRKSRVPEAPPDARPCQAASKQGEEGESAMAVVRVCTESSQQILKFQEEAGVMAWKLTIESEPGPTTLPGGPHAASLAAFVLDKCPHICSWGKGSFPGSLLTMAAYQLLRAGSRQLWQHWTAEVQVLVLAPLPLNSLMSLAFQKEVL